MSSGPGPGAGGDLGRELMQRFVVSILAISRDPKVAGWLDRPRTRLVPAASFLAGCAVATIVWWRWDGMGVMALGYLTTPLLAPIAAIWPASRLARRRLPDVPRFRGSTAAVPFYALAGAACVVCAACCVPGVWRATDGYIVIGPVVTVILAAVLTPMFLVFEWQTRRDELQASAPGESPDP